MAVLMGSSEEKKDLFINTKSNHRPNTQAQQLSVSSFLRPSAPNVQQDILVRRPMPPGILVAFVHLGEFDHNGMYIGFPCSAMSTLWTQLWQWFPLLSSAAATMEGPSPPPAEQKSGNSLQHALQRPPGELQALDEEGNLILRTGKESPESDGCYKPREGTVIPSSQGPPGVGCQAKGHLALTRCVDEMYLGWLVEEM